MQMLLCSQSSFSSAAQLSSFHAIFNLLGVILTWPIVARMMAMPETRFRSAEEDQGKPRYLDKTEQAMPALALEALDREVSHMGGLAIATVNHALAHAESPELARNQAQWLSHILMQARYFVAATELPAESAASRSEGTSGLGSEDLPEAVEFAWAARVLLMLCAETAASGQTAVLQSAREKAENAYQAMKSRLLQLGVEERIAVPGMDAQLRNACIPLGQRAEPEAAVHAT